MDAISWEAEYADGTVLREINDGRYQDINREQLKSFRLVSPGEVVIELFAGGSRTGHNLCYRRRTGLTQGGTRRTWYILGWVPQGPVYAIDPKHREAYTLPAFKEGDALLYPPAPIPEAGERFTLTEKIMSTDAVLEASDIVLPSGFVIRKN
jgi:hypothetical protein